MTLFVLTFGNSERSTSRIDEMAKTVILGREYDQDLRKAVMDVVRQLDSSLETERSAVVGSQEIETVVARFAGREVTIEAETYVGLSITGDEEMIDLILERTRLASRVTPP